MTAKEAAKFLRVSINHLYAMLKSEDPNERIPAFRSGNKWLIHRDVLEERIKRGNNL
ncbi:helix-turn-helix domain-containing protein [uncultured Trichococcus sp.]|uniref:helix-turn-helix domain-containing protein n=1 Tax=uncultured Trichococcus sp. TaxID=189665 RepID=UPI0029C91C54|nr:helix-turn-helix domain-containing protein [uncultured Trichococcus sp.]